VFFAASASAQTLSDLDSRRKKAEEEIAYIDKLLKQNTTDKANTTQQLDLMQKKIKSRKQLIADMDAKIQLLGNDINKKQDEIASLQTHFDTLRKSYEQLLYQAYKNRSQRVWLMFILSSDDIGLAYRRWHYFKHYAAYINEQAQKIKQTSEQISAEMVEQNRQKENMAQHMAQRQREMQTLEKEEADVRKMVRSLAGQEAELIRKMNTQRRTVERINKQIEQMIIDQAKKDRQKQKETPNLPVIDKTLSADFEKNRGLLPWPVRKGVITERFGVHYHPVFKNIKLLPNNGIDISTEANSPVLCVFNGIVRRVVTVPGMNNCVMVQHGEYYTMYCKLSSVNVKVGDSVITGQTLGTVFTTDNTVLHFQVWKTKNKGEPEKINPELWLKK
jgi:septal ring factor EnvC (AmiA/AmiB activator)